MMPRTLVCFGLALVVLVAALVLPDPPPAAPVTRGVLDLEGIREVEIQAPGGVGVVLRNDATPGFELFDPDQAVTQRRDGDRLVLASPSSGQFDLQVRLPTSVRTLIVPGARITSAAKTESLQVQTTGAIFWGGDAAELHIQDLRPAVAPGQASAEQPESVSLAAAVATNEDCLGECGKVVAIESGHIGRLEVDLRRGGLGINLPSQVGEARLRLGPKAWFTLGPSRSLDHIHIQQDGTAEPDAAAGESTE
ncbi:hypothetical protein [Arenimonas caeni]|uniref:Auto-transporter adhesin head GIN domain-containing protein n=1 Tax=Arenimonas caeni TaxID=2058085 RepID=A0A2P6M8F3_9GAMM|nr:hypothetical protein [Arenimonas caeni]PRH82275.1 hypothetical protein C6N40_08470 [Arenimonas caeni]